MPKHKPNPRLQGRFTLGHALAIAFVLIVGGITIRDGGSLFWLLLCLLAVAYLLHSLFEWLLRWLAPHDEPPAE